MILNTHARTHAHTHTNNAYIKNTSMQQYASKYDGHRHKHCQPATKHVDGRLVLVDV